MTSYLNLGPEEIGLCQSLRLLPYFIFITMAGKFSDVYGPQRIYIVFCALYIILLIFYLSFNGNYYSFSLEVYCFLIGTISSIVNPALDSSMTQNTISQTKGKVTKFHFLYHFSKMTIIFSNLCSCLDSVKEWFYVNIFIVLVSYFSFLLHLIQRKKSINFSKNKSGLIPVSQRNINLKNSHKSILYIQILLGLTFLPIGTVLWPIVLRDKFGTEGSGIVFLFFLFYLGNATSTFLASKNISILNNKHYTFFIIINTINVFLTPLFDSIIYFYTLVFCFGFVSGIYGPMMYSSYIHNLSNDYKHKYISLYYGCFLGSATLGCYILGILLENVIYNSIFYFLGSLVLLGLLVLFIYNRRYQTVVM